MIKALNFALLVLFFLLVALAITVLPALAQDAPSSSNVGCLLPGTGITTAAVAPSNGCTGIITVNSGAEQTISMVSPAVTSVSSTPFGFAQITAPGTVDNFVASALSYTCSVAPVVTVLNCASTDTTCASGATVGTATVSAAGTAYIGTISTALISTASHFLAAKVSSGTCTALQINVAIAEHVN